jgi:hypothetical protein
MQFIVSKFSPYEYTKCVQHIHGLYNFTNVNTATAQTVYLIFVFFFLKNCNSSACLTSFDNLFS